MMGFGFITFFNDKTGAFLVNEKREIFFGSGAEKVFFLDTDVYDAGVDVREVLKTQDPR